MHAVVGLGEEPFEGPRVRLRGSLRQLEVGPMGHARLLATASVASRTLHTVARRRGGDLTIPGRSGGRSEKSPPSLRLENPMLAPPSRDRDLVA
jgi:hypothetical protein